MSKLILGIMFIFTIGCSTPHHLVQVESVDRVQIDQEKYIKPEFYISEYNSTKSSRSPASVESDSKSKNYSNRELYFLTSYKQFKGLAKMLGKSGQMNMCPSFHDVILEESKLSVLTQKFEFKNINFSPVRNNEKEIAYYPVLALPYKGEDLYTTLVKNNWQNTNEHVEGALIELYTNKKKEIETLCDRGLESGFYVFDNLVTYFSEQKKFHRTTDGLKALMKVPVLASMLILDNLSLVNIAFTQSDQFEKILLKRAKTPWFADYILHLRERRSRSANLSMDNSKEDLPKVIFQNPNLKFVYNMN